MVGKKKRVCYCFQEAEGEGMKKEGGAPDATAIKGGKSQRAKKKSSGEEQDLTVNRNSVDYL